MSTHDQETLQQAAVYVRMSTEHQRYSIDSQTAAIIAYAAERSLRIVRTYADRGRSGLTIESRPALTQLLQDVLAGGQGFSRVLVYDISRWGRFQDIDESAHYEFLLRQAGVAVTYCAEPFDNDGSPYSAVVKSIKRVMAGEYSRELSVKVCAARARLAADGYWYGGTPGLGLRRLLVDRNGRPKGELGPYEKKSIGSDRVILTLGPKAEIAAVRRVFAMYLRERKNQSEIADWLNRKGFTRPHGRAWTALAVHRLLTNENYVGDMITGRIMERMKTRRFIRPPQEWVRTPGVVEPIIGRATFEKVGRILSVKSKRLSDERLLELLGDLLKRKGALSEALIDADLFTPTCKAYLNHFGSLREAFRRIGYAHARDHSFYDRLAQAEPQFAELKAEIQRGYEAAGSGLDWTGRRYGLVAGELRLLIAIALPGLGPDGEPRWQVFARTQAAPDLCVVMRMDVGDMTRLDYLIFPRSLMTLTGRLSVKREPSRRLKPFHHAVLDPLFAITSPRDLALITEARP